MVSVPFLPRRRLANEPGQGRGKPPPAGKHSPASSSELPAAPINHRRSPGEPGAAGRDLSPAGPRRHRGLGASRSGSRSLLAHGTPSAGARASPWGCALTPAAWPWRGPREEARNGRPPRTRSGDLSLGKVRAGAPPDCADRDRVGGARRRRGRTGSCPCLGQGRGHGVAKQEVAPLCSRPAWHRRPAPGGRLGAMWPPRAPRDWGPSARQPGLGKRHDGPSSATWAPSIRFLRSRRVMPLPRSPQWGTRALSGRRRLRSAGRPSPAPLSARLGRGVVGGVRRGQRPPLCPGPSNTRGRRQRLAQPLLLPLRASGGDRCTLRVRGPRRVPSPSHAPVLTASTESC